MIFTITYTGVAIGLDYIHNNPVEGGLVRKAEEWKFISAVDYYDGKALLEIMKTLIYNVLSRNIYPAAQNKAAYLRQFGGKLDYMHINPLQPHWKLCKEPAKYGFHRLSFMKQEKMIR